MERLTSRYADGLARCEVKHCSLTPSNRGNTDCDNCWVSRIIDKLADFEDAEERGDWISVEDRLQGYGGFQTFDHEPTEQEVLEAAGKIIGEMTGTILARGMVRKSDLRDSLNRREWMVGIKVYLPVQPRKRKVVAAPITIKPAPPKEALDGTEE